MGIAISEMEVQKKKNLNILSTEMFVKFVESSDLTRVAPLLKCSAPIVGEWQEIKNTCIVWATLTKQNKKTNTKVCLNLEY